MRLGSLGSLGYKGASQPDGNSAPLSAAERTTHDRGTPLNAGGVGEATS